MIELRFPHSSTVASCVLLLAVLVAGVDTRAETCGDANGDGTIGVTDGVQVLRAAAGLSSSCTPSVCDVNGADGISVTDGVQVLRAAASLEQPLPCTGATSPTPTGPIPSPTPNAMTRLDLGCPDEPLTVGETFEVRIVLDAADGVTVASASTRLTFGGDLEFVPQAIGAPCSFVQCGGPPGAVTCACATQSEIPDGTIIEARLRLNSCSLGTRIDIDEPQVLNVDGNPVDVVAGNGCALACK